MSDMHVSELLECCQNTLLGLWLECALQVLTLSVARYAMLNEQQCRLSCQQSQELHGTCHHKGLRAAAG